MSNLNVRKRIHWLGAGLSSGPGIIRMAESGREIILWNRTLARAEEVLRAAKQAPRASARAFSPQALQAEVRAGDIVVSMLPAPMHPEVAEIVLTRQAHLVTTSYISDPMRALDAKAKAVGVCFVNECGLDPGIDHVLAHELVSEYRNSPTFSPNHRLVFKSYCGGIPRVPNDFRYKFSWSPAGVIRALTNRARFRQEGHERTIERAWDAIVPMTIFGESFETYPNRDSIPYEQEYGLHGLGTIDTFIRGTIRLEGWSSAWQGIFQRIPTMTTAEIEVLGAQLWERYAYLPGEEDRVVLFVSLEAFNGSSDALAQPVWSKSYGLDESGQGRETAMGKLVSIPATFAIEAIEEGRAPLGVSGAPHDSESIRIWFDGLAREGVVIKSHV